jgi:hypothetical protein
MPGARRIAAGVALAVALAPAASGCGDGANGAAKAELPHGSTPVKLDPRDFSTSIDNRYWPIRPRTRWTCRETDQEGSDQKVVVTVTDAEKRIANGIVARVVRDTVTEGGRVVEDTFDWYAQDERGDVWYLGEDTAEFENGRPVSTKGSWEAGVNGAQPGVMVPAEPREGMAYREEYYRGEAQDNGEVLSTTEMVQAPAGQFDDALLIRDSTPLEPRLLEYKLYAPGVGPVVSVGISGGPGSREELVDVRRVSRREAAAAGTAPLGKPG